MALLSGEFYNKVDDKGRLMLPSRLRTLLAADQVVVTKGMDGKCLALFSPQGFEKSVSFVTGGDDGDIFSSKVRAFTRRFIAPAQTLDLDSAGRINIPQSLREYADITPKCETVIIGMGQYVEIWERGEYENLDNSMSLSELADEVSAERRGR